MSKNRIVVNVSDAKVSRDPSDVIMTHSLGSCIAVCLYDPATHIGGMLHYQLPHSRDDNQRAKEKPFMYADTGMSKLVSKLISMGAKEKRMKIKIAGGAAMDTGPKGFDIGKRIQIGPNARHQFLNIPANSVVRLGIGIRPC